MMRRKLYIYIFSIFTAALVALPLPALAADVIGVPCSSLTGAERLDSPACSGNTPQGEGGNDIYGPNGVLTRVASLIAVVVGIASVIMIIIGGLKYVLSSGDPTNVKSAKDTVLFAIVGILVALSAQSLVVFVLSRL